jgi:lipopolysaccharide/colanic/teichoic acid biosynthesis glycosyltransferase
LSQVLVPKALTRHPLEDRSLAQLNIHGASAPMSTLNPSSIPPLNPANAAITQDEAQLQVALPWRTDWLTLEGLRFVAKRAMDMAGALTGLMLLMPLMMLIALRIRWDSPGPVLFRQSRRGYRGRPFQMLKFRTMTVDAEQQLTDLEGSNESEGGVLFKLRNDPRVTPLGALLRRSSLDELPQLINVLRAEMSLVGPRPLQIRDSDRLRELDPEGYEGRLRVLPGVTGPWQVSGRSELNHERMVELDLDYVKNWSPGRDLWIICKTFWVVIRGKGAY